MRFTIIYVPLEVRIRGLLLEEIKFFICSEEHHTPREGSVSVFPQVSKIISFDVSRWLTSTKVPYRS
jgi:hypothetical protein